jgi:DNA repair exonuclease SbcCD ATPase subunit
MKTFLPWLVAVLAMVAAGVYYQSTKSKSVEVATLQAEVKELETMRTELAELKSQQVPAEELARLRKDNQDLLRLRNEIRQARDEKNQLAKQTQSALSEVQRAQAQAQAAQVQVQSLSTNLQAAQALSATQQAIAARYGLALTAEQAAVNTCINHLRQLDGAKQQWALENKKTAEATPTTQDLMPYLKDLIPVCPSGGKYTFGAVSAAPTCSIASHILSQQ